MKVSYNWLQDYFSAQGGSALGGETSLPTAEAVAEALTFHAFEIEETIQAGDDMVIDVNVLPNRSSDCLSHRGIAKELSVILDIPLKRDLLRESAALEPISSELFVQLPDDSELVKRFTSAVIKQVKVGPSPEWLVARLEAMGQHSINNIVDITNYVMFDMGQPLHAFDAEKIAEKNGKRKIGVRAGESGQTLKTLDGNEYEVGPDDLLIYDFNADHVLSIAGVKGGEASQITEATQTIVLEAANFSRVHVRKTSQKLKLRTDASLRFENEPSPELAAYGLREAARLIQEIAGGTLEGYVDVYPQKLPQEPVSVTLEEVNRALGLNLSTSDVHSILKRFGYEYTQDGEMFTVTPPFERTDIAIKEDLIEEIGRIYGYKNVEPVVLQKTDGAEINKRHFYSEKVRRFLVEQGFSEVYTSSFRDAGEVELANALASDKNFLRKNLSGNIKDSLDLNARNAPLLGLEVVKVFEIGNTFPAQDERISLALGVRGTDKTRIKNQDAELERAVDGLREHLGAELTGETKDGIFETDLGALLSKLPDPDSYDTRLRSSFGGQVSYKPFSLYPFALRDIAVWTPAGTEPREVLEVIKNEAGDLLVNHSLFDTFEKPARADEAGGDGRVSYAFHLVFQSKEKTLTDVELNDIMESVYKAMSDRGWEVR